MAKKREAPASVRAAPAQAADDAVEEVDQRLGRAHEREALLGLDAGAVERVGRDADRDRAVVADGLAHLLERLQPEARAVLERAAVGVRAVVVARREELRRQVGVRAVDVDDVEARLARPHAPRTTQSACVRRMSESSIAFGTTSGSNSLAIWLGASGTVRDSRASTWMPPCHSSTAASAPCACASSVISRSARTSPSSHRRAEMYGYSSLSGLIAQYSVHTERPAALGLHARGARACVHGFSTPNPVQCGTW